MRLQKINDLSALSDTDYINWKRQALHSGLITNGTSFNQMNRLYSMQQIQNAGLDPNMSLDQANAILATRQLSKYLQDGQLGEEVAPLIELYNSNPVLANQLTQELFDSGYMTLDEKNKAALNNINDGGEEGTSWLRGAWSDITSFFGRDKGLPKDQDKDEFSTRAFNDYYRQVKDSKLESAIGKAEQEKDPDKFEKETIEEARRTYLDAKNKNIFSGIQQKIDEYWDQQAEEMAQSGVQEYNAIDTSPQASNAIAAEFNQIVNPRTEEVTDKYGQTRIIEHQGSNYWRAFKNSAFDAFTLDNKKKVLAKYKAYDKLLGPEKADQWLEDTMQTWVSDHQPMGERILNTTEAFGSTVLNNVFPRMFSFGVYGVAKLADWATWLAGKFTGHEDQTNIFGDVASIISTGKTQNGQSAEDAGFGRTLGMEDGNLFWLRNDYLNKVDQYNAWDRKTQQWIEDNNGVTRYQQYVLKPGETTPDFLSIATVQDILGMTSQAVGFTTSLALWGSGKNFESLASQVSRGGAKALLTKEASGTTLAGLRDAVVTATPIAESYAYGTWQQTYNGALQQALDNTFQTMSIDQNYQESREAAYQNWLNEGSEETGKVIRVDSPETRNYFNQQYDAEQYKQLGEDIKSGKRKDLSSLVQASALDAYMTSFIGEMGKYGMLNAIMNPLKVLKSPNQVLANEMRLNTYGKLTQTANGKFANEGLPLLGIKKWTTTNPRVIGAYKVANNALIQGGLSNYTDELTTGFAMGYGLSQFNSEYLRRYDPEAYARTWHGGSAIGKFMQAVGEGISGAVKAGLTEQAYHAFEIGALGGIFTPRIGGNRKMLERYAEENAEYKKKTGKDVSRGKKARQWFNVLVTGAVGEYELARMTLKDQAKAIDSYNKTLDQRDKLLTELASLNSGISNAAIASSQNDFSAAAAAQDALAMKLLFNDRKLSMNPLHQISNQQMQTDIAQLHYIAQDAVSEEEKNRLITQALSTSQTTSQSPVSQQMKDQTWEEIKSSASRMTQFIDDFQAEEANLLKTDEALGKPENYPLLTQRAELKAQEKRIKRDIEQLSRDSGVQIDLSKEGTYGQMTPSQMTSLVKGAQHTIDKLTKQKEDNAKKLDELNSKLASETDSAKIKDIKEDIAKTKAQIRGADRQISELKKGIESVQNNELLTARSGLSQDAVILNDMLTNTEQYTNEQQVEIEEFRSQIGPKGETYIQEMAKLQDSLTDNKYAQESIQKNPQDFLVIKTAYDNVREHARNRAIYEQLLSNQFAEIADKPEELVGITAALNLSPQEFSRFQQEYPSLSPIVEQYASINSAFDTINTLFNPSDETVRENVLGQIAQLMYEDFDYIQENGSQGVADMIQFLKGAHAGSPIEGELGTLLTDYLRAESISKSTIAYAEYKVKEGYEKLLQPLADQLVEETARVEAQAQKQAQQSAQESQTQDTTPQELVPDMASMENETGEAIDLGDTEGESTETPKEEPSEPGEAPEPPTQEGTQPAAEQAETQPGLPAGVTRNSEGQIETMSIEQQAEQLGITPVSQETMVDDNAPIPQESTSQQDEVHGCYFNPYNSSSLNVGELIPLTEGPMYEWLASQGIKLGAIIDDELHNILQVNPKIQLMKVKNEGDGAKVASNVFLVVEYTDKVAKQHLPENGGVIISNGKQYLIVGTMWNTKSQNNTEAASTMQVTRNTLQKKGVEFFDANPTESYYVDPVMNTEVTTFYSGHIVHTIEGQESRPHTISELVDEYNRTHTAANQISMADLGFAAITMREGFYPVGPVDVAEAKKHKPQRFADLDKYGQVYVLVKAANGETVPIFINPTLVSEINEDSALSKHIDSCIYNLMSENYAERELAMQDLCGLLCISGSITYPDIGTKDIPTVTLVNGKSKIHPTFNMKDHTVNGRPFSFQEFRNAIRQQLNPRINLSLSNLTQESWIKRYDEAGALTTDATKLGTYGGKYYVAPIDPSTGQPISVTPKVTVSEGTSDYSRAQAGPTMLHVSGKRYVFRDGRWKHQDGSAVTERAEQVQVILAYKVQTGQASLVQREGPLDYYVMGVETSEPKVMRFNIITRQYEGVSPEKAAEIVAIKRAEIEKAKADAEAQRVLDEAPSVTESEAEPINSRAGTSSDSGQGDEVATDEITTWQDRLEAAGFEVKGVFPGLITKNADDGTDGGRLAPVKAEVVRRRVRNVFEHGGDTTAMHDAVVSKAIGTKANVNVLHALYKLQKKVANGEVSIDDAMAYVESLLYIEPVSSEPSIENIEAERKLDEEANQKYKREIIERKNRIKDERSKRRQNGTDKQIFKPLSFDQWSKYNSGRTSSWEYYRDQTIRNYGGIEYVTGEAYLSALQPSIYIAVEAGILSTKYLSYIDSTRDKSIVKEDLQEIIDEFKKLGINSPADLVNYINQEAQESTAEAQQESPINAQESIEIPSEILDFLSSPDYNGTISEIQRKFDINYPTAIKYKEAYEAMKQQQQDSSTGKQKGNSFELKTTGTREKYTVDQILDSVDETIGDYAIRILDIIDAKIAKNSEKWRNFDKSNISEELQRLGIDTSNIEDIESWIDNLENCE